VGFGIFIGIGFSLGGMLAVMTVLNNWFVKKRTMALSIALASAGLGGIVILPLLMNLITTIGWRITYRIIAAAIFICCILIPGLFLKNTPSDLGQSPDGLTSKKTKTSEQGTSTSSGLYTTPVDFTAKEALRTPAFWCIVGYSAFMLVGMQVLMIHQVAFLFDIGITATMAGLAAGIMSAFMTGSQVLVGFLGLKFNMQSLAVLSVVSVMIGFVILFFTRSFPLVFAYNFFMGAGFGIQMLAMSTLLPNYFGIKEFPKIMGFAIPIGTFIGAVGGPGAGMIREMTGSYLLAFQISLCIIAVAFFCILFAKPPVHYSLIGVKQEET
jgi:MFS family permease